MYSLAIGCNNSVQSNYSNWNFESIQYQKELYLIQTDDRFGEWGGNTYLIRVYRENQTEQILLDYKEFEGKPGPPQPPHPDSIPITILEWLEREPVLNEKNRIKANENYLKLIAGAIQELMEIRINNSEYVTMSGVVNRVLNSDSSLIIVDYPSTNWEKFQTVRNKIKKE
jgi:hypothetical protein